MPVPTSDIAKAVSFLRSGANPRGEGERILLALLRAETALPADVQVALRIAFAPISPWRRFAGWCPIVVGDAVDSNTLAPLVARIVIRRGAPPLAIRGMINTQNFCAIFNAGREEDYKPAGIRSEEQNRILFANYLKGDLDHAFRISLADAFDPKGFSKCHLRLMSREKPPAWRPTNKAAINSLGAVLAKASIAAAIGSEPKKSRTDMMEAEASKQGISSDYLRKNILKQARVKSRTADQFVLTAFCDEHEIQWDEQDGKLYSFRYGRFLKPSECAYRSQYPNKDPKK